MKKKSLSAKKTIHKLLLNYLNNSKINKVFNGFKNYLDLFIRKKDKIGVAISGGPDSLALAFLAKCYFLTNKLDAKFFIVDKSFKPFTYFNNMLPIFAAAIVGGIGNPFGAFLGGYVIAFSEILLTYAYRKFFVYILPESLEPDSLIQLLSTDYKFAVSFSILVIVLLFRPSGIFKGKVI